MLAAATLHARLSAYYAGFYAVLGALLPYFGLWLAARDLSPTQIGLIFSVHGATRVALPLAWGWVADRSGRRMWLIRLASLMALLGFVILPFAQSYTAILLAVVVFSVFWNATMPQFEAVTLGHLRVTGGDYSRVRLWGSVGFVVAVVGLGYLFDVVSINYLPWIMLAFLAWMVISASLIPDSQMLAAQDEQSSATIWDVLRQPVVMALLLVVFCSQLSFAPYYSFFSLYLERQAYPPGQIGLLWAFGVVLEIWVFVYTGRLIVRYGVHAMMVLALASTALRWTLLPPFVDNVPVLLLLQALHMSSFGIFHACGIYYIGSLFPAHLQGRGQALYVTCGFGAGGSLGAWLSGWIWENQSPDAMYYMAGGVAAAGAVVAWRFLFNPDVGGQARVSAAR